MIEPVEMVMKIEENPDEEDIDTLKLDYKDDDSASESVYKEHVKIVKFMKKKPLDKHHVKAGKREERAQKIMNDECNSTRLVFIEEKIKYHEEQIIPNPTNKREMLKNKISESNIAVQKSLREYITTGCSKRKAGKKFGVSEFSVRKALSMPEKEYHGRGRRSAVFSQAEEERIAKRLNRQTIFNF